MTLSSTFASVRIAGSSPACRSLKPARVLCCLLIGLAAGNTAFADLLAYEGFEYDEVGERLLGKDGGLGFAGPWESANGVGSRPLTIAEGSLNYEGLASSGDRLYVESEGGWDTLVRHPASIIGRKDTGTMYMSFLMRPEVGSSRTERPIGFGAVGFIGELDGNAPWAGYTGSQYAMSEWVQRSEFKTAGVTAELDETAFFVVRADMTPGDDTFTFYVNPIPGEPEPDTGIDKAETLPGLGRIYIVAGDSGGFSVDEIRLGETYADVTPILTEDILGDFDGNHRLSTDDLDLLCSEVQSGGNSSTFNLTNDELVNAEDVSVFLQHASSLPGDADLSGEVDFADFLQLAARFGELGSWSHGDFDCSGSVEFPDFLILSSHFGQSSSESNLAVVPEPAAIVSLLLAAGCFCRIRRTWSDRGQLVLGSVRSKY